MEQGMSPQGSIVISKSSIKLDMLLSYLQLMRQKAVLSAAYGGGMREVVIKENPNYLRREL